MRAHAPPGEQSSPGSQPPGQQFHLGAERPGQGHCRPQPATVRAVPNQVGDHPAKGHHPDGQPPVFRLVPGPVQLLAGVLQPLQQSQQPLPQWL